MIAAIAIHEISTTVRVKTCQLQTRSALERNFIAAAISSRPIVTFVARSQAPDFGSDPTACGTMASATNGSANTVEKASIPASGHCQAPCDATTSSVPRNGAVHVKDVSVN